MSERYEDRMTLTEHSASVNTATLKSPMRASSVSATRRRPKTEKELYAEVEARAKSLKEKLLARRAKNRDRLIEDLYREFAVEVIDGDLDEADRLSELRSLLGHRLGAEAQGLR